jgi:hypothetical protein
MTPGSGNIKWLVKRAAAMTLSELFVRAVRTVSKIKWRIKPPEYQPTIINFPAKLSPLGIKKELISDSESTRLLDEADEYLEHYWKFFGLTDCIEDVIDWHMDPQSNISSPKKYGFNINHRDESLVGDIKNTWEKNRHHHLTILSIAYYLTKKEKYAIEVKNQIFSWIEQNPYLIGVNWTHPLEHGIRLISWVFCERFLRNSRHYEDVFGKESGFWKSVYEHQKFICKTYSIGSSANNHLIGEMAGLYISSQVWPYFKESYEWSSFSKKMLEKEIQKQTFSTGINKELAFSYQIFVLEFTLLCIYFTNIKSKQFSSEFLHITNKMLYALNELTCQNSALPNYGDGDEGMAIQLQSIHGNRATWLLEVGKSILHSPIGLSKYNLLPSVLLDNCSVSNYADDNKKKSAAFHDAGLYILRSIEVENTPSVECLIDVGPLGYGNMAAHGHADALHYTISVDNVAFVVDPGTYCYHTDHKWREYFRGTLAHNTINVNGQNQSLSLGPFLWGRKAITNLQACDLKTNFIKGAHNGYQSIGVIHNRSFLLKKNSFKVNDELQIRNSVIIENRIHLHPGVSIIKKKNEFVLKRNDICVHLAFGDLYEEVSVINGKENGGWFSPFFKSKVATNTICLKRNCDRDFSSEMIYKIKRV